MPTTQQFDRYTLRLSKYSGVDVLGWGTYPRHSVLAGQPMKVFLDNYPDEEAARAAYPQAAQSFSSAWTDPQVSLSHLPDEDDPVAGGQAMTTAQLVRAAKAHLATAHGLRTGTVCAGWDAASVAFFYEAQLQHVRYYRRLALLAYSKGGALS